MLFFYVISSLINIWSAFNRIEFLFVITKPLLMLSLLGVYITNSVVVLIQVVLALLFAWLGDMFLLYRSKREKKGVSPLQLSCLLTLAGIAFSSCHLLYVLTFILLRNPHNNGGTLSITGLVYIIIGIFLYISLIRGFSGLDVYLKIGLKIYTFFILMMSFSSTFIIDINQLYTLFPFIGSWLFIFSDYLLAYGYKHNSSSTYHPWVMLSYLTAQFLIIAGLLLLRI